jgi:phosphoribosylanthranilate isomerase
MSYLRVKICGITSLDDALWAAEAGADAIGLIFVEGTPRYIPPAAASAIVAGLPPFVCPVGVFWDHPPAHVTTVVTECGLAAVQLHGVEPPEVVAAMSRPTLNSPARWSEGEVRAPISWRLAREAAVRARVILAAGLTPETVAEAVRMARPWGVDVNSGVETAPGRKDPVKVRQFVRAARAAAGALASPGEDSRG